MDIFLSLNTAQAQQAFLTAIQMEELKNEILIGMGDKSIPFEATKTKIDLYFTQKKIQQAGQPFYEM